MRITTNARFCAVAVVIIVFNKIILVLLSCTPYNSTCLHSQLFRAHLVHVVCTCLHSTGVNYLVVCAVMP
jgi:hypothetical protein